MRRLSAKTVNELAIAAVWLRKLALKGRRPKCRSKTPPIEWLLDHTDGCRLLYASQCCQWVAEKHRPKGRKRRGGASQGGGDG